MTKPIDRDKLLAWLEERIKNAKYGKEAQAFVDVVEEIQSGAFDADSSEIERPPVEHVAWTLGKIAEHINQGGGSFRKLVYDRMGFGRDAYQRLYEAGGMAMTNAIEDAKETERLREALTKALSQSPQMEPANELYRDIDTIAQMMGVKMQTEPSGERVREKMKSLFEAWDLRGICKDSLEGYEQGVMLELIGLCEELVGINAPETEKEGRT